MRALVLTRHKDPLVERDVPEPIVGEFRQILPYTLPRTLGHDVAGTVLAVGSAVRSFAPGDEVWSRPPTEHIGTFAERIAVPESDVAPKPAGISMAEAGSLPLVALTAWQALVERGGLQAGQTVLIHAGSGGVGTIAIQLAKHLGATVVTTASARNADFLRELGADVVIDYHTDDLDTLSGVDLVLDSVGGETLEKSLRVLKRGGKAIGITGPPDPAFASDAGLNIVVRTAIAVISRKIRRRAAKADVSYEFLFMHPDGGQLREIAALIENGALRPVVGRTITFDEIPEALSAMSAGGNRGKIVATRPVA